MNSQNNKMTRRFTIIAAVILAVSLVTAFIFDLFPRIRKEAVVKGISEYKTDTIAPDSSADYSLEFLRTSFDSIVFFVMDGDASSLSVTITYSGNGTEVLKDVRITKEMCAPEGKTTTVRLTSVSGRFSPDRYKVKISNNSEAPVSVASGKNDESLTVRLLVKTNTGYITAAVVCCLLVVFAAMTMCLYLKEGLNPPPAPEKLFLAAAIPLCAAMIILLPPWSTGDSEAHYLACYRLSNLFLGQGFDGQWLGRADDVAFFRDIWWNSTPPSTGGYEILKSNFSLFASDKSLVQMSSTSEKMNYYSAFCYIPQTFALVVGRLIGFGPVANCYLVKVFTAAFYICLCYRAIKKAPFGKGIIAMCAILPSSLLMSGAFSYDCMVIIVTLNFISSVFLLKTDPDGKKSLVYCCIAAFVLGAVKGGGYLLLLPLVFIVPAGKKALKFLNKVLPIVSGLFSVFLFDMVLPERELFQFGSKGNGFMTASFALENPIAYLIMTVKSYVRFAGELTSDLFGSKLSWGENTIPLAFSLIMLVVLIIVASSDEALDSIKAKDITVMTAVVLIALLTTPAMLLSWTPEGSDVILGIQGHYFLPVLPLFAIAAGKGIRKLASKTGIAKSKAAAAIAMSPYLLVIYLLFFAFYFILRLYTSR